MASINLTTAESHLTENQSASISPKQLLASKCLDPLEVMEILKISIGTLSRLCKDGLLEVSKVGNRLYFDTDDLLKMLQEGKQQYRMEMEKRKKNKGR